MNAHQLPNGTGRLQFPALLKSYSSINMLLCVYLLLLCTLTSIEYGSTIQVSYSERQAETVGVPSLMDSRLKTYQFLDVEFPFDVFLNHNGEEFCPQPACNLSSAACQPQDTLPCNLTTHSCLGFGAQSSVVLFKSCVTTAHTPQM